MRWRESPKAYTDNKTYSLLEYEKSMKTSKQKLVIALSSVKGKGRVIGVGKLWAKKQKSKQNKKLKKNSKIELQNIIYHFE